MNQRDYSKRRIASGVAIEASYQFLEPLHGATIFRPDQQGLLIIERHDAHCLRLRAVELTELLRDLVRRALHERNDRNPVITETAVGETDKLRYLLKLGRRRLDND